MPLKIPTFSVVIPTHNRATIVTRAIESVVNQTEKDWECIVVDDHSTDNTVFTVRNLFKNDSRIKCIANLSRPGAQSARNTGIDASKGQWILLLDSDNTITPNYLKEITKYITAHPSLDVITNYIHVIKDDGTESFTEWPTQGDILKQILSGETYVDNSSACIRRTMLNAIGPLDIHCPSYQEWDTHIRIAQIGKYGCVEQYLTNYYEHVGERVSQRRDTVWANGLYVLRKHRKLWLKTTGKDVYARLLLQVYNERCKLSPLRQWLVALIVVSLSPKLGKQLIKRRLR